MCGILGILCRSDQIERSKFLSALRTLAHRGPDAEGYQHFKDVKPGWDLWLGHRRLSILDLSALGSQPMLGTPDSEGPSAIVFNGEIYNHKELRQGLKSSAHFNSTSDTEVLLRGLEEEGPKFLTKANGMWAFAMWSKGRLLLSRDRIGKKPLYVIEHPNYVAFASELKALHALQFKMSLNEEALAQYRWLGYIPGENTIYRECRKFPAASVLEIKIKDDTLHYGKPQLFWDPLAAYSNHYSGTYEQAIDEFLPLLDDATKIRLEADTPVGIFLSGGIDSALVLSSLAALGKTQVGVYSVAMGNSDFDEFANAKDTADRFGFPINKLQLEKSSFDRQTRLLAHHYDEPFSDSSQIALMAISELAAQHVRVVLTGDGGDEIFMGYPRHNLPARLRSISRFLQALPFSALLLKKSLDATLLSRLLKTVATATGFPPVNLDQKMRRLVAAMLGNADASFIYDCVIALEPRAFLHDSDRRAIGSKSLSSMVKQWYPEYSWDALADRSLSEQFAALDFITYMRDDVLVKVDRGTMAYGLEARAPLLDYRIVEFSRRLPLDFKHRDGRFKAILRDALHRRLKGDAVRRPKRGFGVPLPLDLPSGPSQAARWNKFIEQQWQTQYS